MDPLQSAVLEWGRVARRDLPWRATRDPWAVLVSETMLAQTQVARVIPKWEAFLARWPTPLACADAPTAEVIAAWAGLGYYRRARSLHEAAVVIVDRHGGSVPADLGSLMKLPGVGRYTARAVLAFAFEHRAGVVDTNVARVLARAVAGRPLPWAAAQELADRLVASESPWAWNQSVMDLGATLCTSRQPKCDSCPLGAGRDAAILCAWARDGGPDPALGSAGTSRPQSRFAGSDRQGRGRLLAAVVAAHTAERDGVPPESVAAAAGWPQDGPRAAAVAQRLVDDGLVTVAPDGTLRLP